MYYNQLRSFSTCSRTDPCERRPCGGVPNRDATLDLRAWFGEPELATRRRGGTKNVRSSPDAAAEDRLRLRYRVALAGEQLGHDTRRSCPVLHIIGVRDHNGTRISDSAQDADPVRRYLDQEGKTQTVCRCEGFIHNELVGDSLTFDRGAKQGERQVKQQQVERGGHREEAGSRCQAENQRHRQVKNKRCCQTKSERRYQAEDQRHCATQSRYDTQHIKR